MGTPYRLRKAVGSSYNVDPEDVWATKSSLRSAGYYQEPKYGMTVYPDDQLFESIKSFQRTHGLRVDGVMAPSGETERRLLEQPDVAKTYWCRVCSAPHGGVFSPSICWQCWNKGHR